MGGQPSEVKSGATGDLPRLEMERGQSNSGITSTPTNNELNTRPNAKSDYPNMSQEDRTKIRIILQSFVSTISGGEAVFQSPNTAVLEDACRKEMPIVGMNYSLVEKWFLWACQVADSFYPEHPVDLRVLIVLCNLAIFYIDDVLAANPQLLYSFQLALVTQQPQRDPILQCLAAELIPRMWNYFDPAAASAIAIGFYEFIVGTSMERDTRTMRLSSGAPSFPGFVRLKSGAPAQYAHWLFYSPSRKDPNDYLQAIPDFLEVINHVNDILSFYKEEMGGERDNLLHMRARTSGRSVLTTLADLCVETEAQVQRICEVLAPTPPTQLVFKGFMIRYIHFHTSTTRYRLQELLA